MTREIKIGMAVAGSFLSLVGVVVGTKLYNGDVPQPINGEFAKAGIGGPNPSETPKPSESSGTPGLLRTGGINVEPLAGQPPAIPPVPPAGDNMLPPPVPPAPSSNGFNLPPAIDPAATANAGKSEAQRLQELIEKDAREKNPLLIAVPNSFPSDSKNPSNNPPGEPPANPFTLPPAVDVAQIVTGTKPITPQSPPQSPAPNGLPPAVPEAPKTIINGTPPAPPPSTPDFKPAKDSNPAPVTFGKETPPVTNGLPPAPKEPIPNFGQNPVPPIASPTAPGSQLPPVSDLNKPAIQTPPSTIVAPKSAESPPPAPPFNPQQNTPNNGSPPPAAPPNSLFGPTNPPPPVGNTQNPPGVNPPPVPSFNSTPPGSTPPPPFNGLQQPPDSFVPQPNPNFTPLPPAAQTGPIVKTDNLKPYICQGNENFDQIASREYPGARANLGPALEEFNRQFPDAPQNLRERPARLSFGTRVLIPSQEYLLERFGRFVQGAIQSVPPVSPVNRPLGNDIGLNAPSKLPAVPKSGATAGVTKYRVPTDNMYLSKVAELQLGSALRWIDIYRLNPQLQPEQPLRAGMEIDVPAK